MSAPLPPFVRRLLEEAVTVRVATVSADGTPAIAPFWFHFDGERIVIGTFAGATVRNLRERGDAAVLVDLGERSGEHRGALIRAEARVYAGGEEPERVRRAAAAIDAAHADEMRTAAWAAYHERERRPNVWIELVPTGATSFDLRPEAARVRDSSDHTM